MSPTTVILLHFTNACLIVSVILLCHIVRRLHQRICVLEYERRKDP